MDWQVYVEGKDMNGEKTILIVRQFIVVSIQLLLGQGT